ncbi:MAG: hypothetical protein A4E35_00650 [Methanoregula sp. PtaU1.Bin051]|nr:MAG: hypothetical protein A4E35_00650 [Methanoregula sp. PtaU1.Bin051]
MSTNNWIIAAGSVIILLAFCLPVSGQETAQVTDYSITYTISVLSDGSALWRVEYRTLLPTEDDLSDFDSYTRDLQAVYLPQFRELMEKSAAQAAAATGRHMAVSDVTGTSAVQTSPTGRYGVVIYTLRWDGFAEPGPRLTIGDAFAGGLYLAKGNTLIVQYPDGYTVQAAEPAPDAKRDGLVWYGQLSFGAGEPRVQLEQAAFPLIPVAAGLVVIILAAFIGFFFYRRKKNNFTREEPQVPMLSEAEIRSLEERIIGLLQSQGGEMFQSDIVKNLMLPKSTVSSALNDLHSRGIIVKVKKGRENLIRLT